MSKAYPRMVYSESSTRIVNNEEEESALGDGWFDHPSGVKGAPVDPVTGQVMHAPFDSSPIVTANLPGPVGQGNTFFDRTVWQAQSLGVALSKHWTLEQILDRIAKLQGATKEAIDIANAEIPEDQLLEYDPTLSAEERKAQEKVDAEVKAKGGKASKSAEK